LEWIHVCTYICTHTKKGLRFPLGESRLTTKESIGHKPLTAAGA